ncbi:TIGR03364 family FAD-dependent oxidoreductase [Corynebacterium uropygiale]|uniref:TIGR03364 family FAD-dependent oxidoreductase n=1 Tax=Corynebacterium uropygiale TaxID=1775911 RepID=A0A9X1U8D3_9CORY|nr:TIGR03364 family FAD-dependent oxidoreductase [Corynebacterium uropygiale]MCF4007717.1 TIGR03364 family FAD-dependent oxidoreductase [Corynebacterium uropygiale]
MSTDIADILVVGSGILGLATAYWAHSEGHTVHVLDSADRPVGSSIQNFGHACFTGQSDAVQPLADLSREGWRRAAADAGFWARESGTWIPARTEAELQVVREFAEHRGPERVRLADPAKIAGALGAPSSAEGMIGGAHLPRDMRVNPREVAPRIAEYLAANGVRFTWNTRVLRAEDGVVETTRGMYRGGRVIVCPGMELNQLFPEIAEKYEVRVCSLVMALLERPSRIPEGLAVLTGTSLARYDGFAAMPSVPALREELRDRHPELVDCIANLMLTTIPGGIFMGDSHAYALSPEPFIDERLATLLQDEGAQLLGLRPEERRVRQRWLGRYADSPTINLIVEHPDERTTVAVVASGIGMTLSFGLAKYILDGRPVPAI